MKHILNDPHQAVDAMLAAYQTEHQEQLLIDLPHRIIYQKNRTGVSLISGGGSGHEPAHFGYVGKGMLTASVSGPLFSPPFPDAILRAIELTDTGEGVLLIVKNFASDLEVFKKAQSLALAKGRDVRMVIVSDDVSIESKASYSKRQRGVAGTVLVHKILGYFKAQNKDLDTICHLADTFMPHLFTLGVALTSTQLKDTKPFFSLRDDEVYYGIGIHGEKGYRNEKLLSSEQLAIELYNKLKHLHRFKPFEHYAFLINGLGSTPLLEQYVFTHDINRLCAIDQLSVDFIKTGTCLSAYNMHGISLTCLKITDPRIKSALLAPVEAPHW